MRRDDENTIPEKHIILDSADRDSSGGMTMVYMDYIELTASYSSGIIRDGRASRQPMLQPPSQSPNPDEHDWSCHAS